VINLSSQHRYYLYQGVTDMRKGFDSLSGLVRNEMAGNPMSGSVFIFLNSRRTHIKLLVWDTTGFVLYWKRLERGTFEIPPAESAKSELAWRNLVLILEGINLSSVSYRKRFAANGV
jgi:transposase